MFDRKIYQEYLRYVSRHKNATIRGIFGTDKLVVNLEFRRNSSEIDDYGI